MRKSFSGVWFSFFPALPDDSINMNFMLEMISTEHDEQSDQFGRAKSRVVVSLSTIPARFESLSKCIDSLLQQTKRPDLIIVNIPAYYKRFGICVDDSDIPVLDDPRVVVNRCEDFGPGTKLLGSIPLLLDGDMVVLVDDDLGYHEELVEDLVNCASPGRCAASNHVYEVEAGARHRIGQGADGFVMPFSALRGIQEYFDLIGGNYHLFLNDDIWISFFLEMKGIEILDCTDSPPGSEMLGRKIPKTKVLTDAEGLVDIKGRYSRWRSVYRGIRYLERKRPWLEARVGLRECAPGFSPKVCFADFIDWIRR